MDLLFSWLVGLLCAATEVVMGMFYSMGRYPKAINNFRGIRTSSSMLSQATWHYAHRRMGALYIRIGAIMLGVNVLIFLIAPLILPVTIGNLSVVNAIIGLVGFMIPVPIVDNEIREKFNKEGEPKE